MSRRSLPKNLVELDRINVWVCGKVVSGAVDVTVDDFLVSDTVGLSSRMIISGSATVGMVNRVVVVSTARSVVEDVTVLVSDSAVMVVSVGRLTTSYVLVVVVDDGEKNEADGEDIEVTVTSGLRTS